MVSLFLYTSTRGRYRQQVGPPCNLSLADIRSIHPVIYQCPQPHAYQLMLPVACLIGQSMQFDAQVVIGQPFPTATLVLLDEHLDAHAHKLLAKEAAMLVIEGEQSLTTCFLYLVLDLPSPACGGGSLPGGEAEDVCLR